MHSESNIEICKKFCCIPGMITTAYRFYCSRTLSVHYFGYPDSGYECIEYRLSNGSMERVGFTLGRSHLIYLISDSMRRRQVHGKGAFLNEYGYCLPVAKLFSYASKCCYYQTWCNLQKNMLHEYSQSSYLFILTPSKSEGELRSQFPFCVDGSFFLFPTKTFSEISGDQ